MSKQVIELDKIRAFPMRFTELCEQQPKSLEQWGKIFEVSRQTVSNWQLGQSAPDVVKLTEIAKHFGVSTDFLLGISDTESPDVSVRAAVEYTGLSEKAVKWLHEGLDDFECDGVGLSKRNKSRNLNIASTLIENKAFTQMVQHLGKVTDCAYAEEILHILDEEHATDSEESADEFTFAIAEDRLITLATFRHILTVCDSVNDVEEEIEALTELSDDELCSAMLNGLLTKKDDNELHQFHAAKAFNGFVDTVVDAAISKARMFMDKFVDEK